MTFQSWLSSFQGPQIAAGDTRQYSPNQDVGSFGRRIGSIFDRQLGEQWGRDPYGHPATPPDMFAGHQVDPRFYTDMQQQFTDAQSFLMDQTGPGGMLSSASQNPYTRQLAEGSAYAERERQNNMGYGMAAAGVNPLMAQRAIGEGNQYSTEQLGTQFAQFEADLMQRQFGAGEGLVNLSNALNSEMTGRREDQSRWLAEYQLSDKHGADMIDAAEKGAQNDLIGSVLGIAGLF